jgi:hypothetical protein
MKEPGVEHWIGGLRAGGLASHGDSSGFLKRYLAYQKDLLSFGCDANALLLGYCERTDRSITDARRF